MKYYCLHLIIFLLFYCTGLHSQDALIIDHSCTTLTEIPSEWINKARQDLHIAYGHTSHGSQLISGMTSLYDKYGSAYAFNNGGTNGTLDLHDYFADGDLGNPDRTTWATRTRSYLNNPVNADINVVIWSWCGQAGSATQADIEVYLSLMSQLETEFPQIRFIYMTGHLDGTGEAGNLTERNNQIRTYCSNHNKILFDFADIESYDPYWLTDYMVRMANDNCDYDSDNNGSRDANWAVQWCASHPDDCYYTGDCAHSQALNCRQKGIASWWLWAILAGWNETSSCPEDLIRDGIINISDYNQLVGQYGVTCQLPCDADFDGDNRVGIYDYLRLIGKYGHSCSTNP